MIPTLVENEKAHFLASNGRINLCDKFQIIIKNLPM